MPTGISVTCCPSRYAGGDAEATGSRLQHVDWSDDKMSQLLTQFQSQPEVGSGSGSEGAGDDELGDDEDADEDEEDKDS
ncbi:hypothetical protein Tco_0241381 [Tanacetum coccineum]